MENHTKSSTFFFLLYAFIFPVLLMAIGYEVDGCDDRSPRRKLFVFGDSFVDTGNLGKIGREFTRSWYSPYGSTFPRRPTGRFSDGRVLTDYFASFMGIKSPLPYKFRRTGRRLLPYGMNFAVAGSGVFDTGNFQKNLAGQIDAFEAQTREGVFSDCDLRSSVALVAISGNDYSRYKENCGKMEGIFKFVAQLMSQFESDLKRLGDLGIQKVVVTTLFPLGCTPLVSRGYNYTSCDGTDNLAVMEHNSKLHDALEQLQKANNHTTFLSLDLFTAISSIVNPGNGSSKFANTLRPCCTGRTNGTLCGQIDEQGAEQYTLCRDPEDYFFWDDVHPTQTGWAAVFERLKPSLSKFLL